MMISLHTSAVILFAFMWLWAMFGAFMMWYVLQVWRPDVTKVKTWKLCLLLGAFVAVTMTGGLAVNWAMRVLSAEPSASGF